MLVTHTTVLWLMFFCSDVSEKGALSFIFLVIKFAVSVSVSKLAKTFQIPV